MTPDYCPKCKEKGVIAPLNGPTCQHRPKKDYWPEWWQSATEYRRIQWLELQQTPKKN